MSIGMTISPRASSLLSESGSDCSVAAQMRKHHKFKPCPVPYFDKAINSATHHKGKENGEDTLCHDLAGSETIEDTPPRFINGSLDILPFHDGGSEIHLREGGHSLDMLLLDDNSPVPSHHKDPRDDPRINQVISSLTSLPKPRKSRRVSFADDFLDVPDVSDAKDAILPDITKTKDRFQVHRVPNYKIPPISKPQRENCRNVKHNMKQKSESDTAKCAPKKTPKYIAVLKPTKKSVDPANPLALMVKPVPKYSSESISRRLSNIQQELSLLWQTPLGSLYSTPSVSENFKEEQVKCKTASNIFLTPQAISHAGPGKHGNSHQSKSKKCPAKLPPIDTAGLSETTLLAEDSTKRLSYDKCDLLPHQQDGLLDKRRDAVVEGMSKALDSVGLCCYDKHNKYDPLMYHQQDGSLDERRDAVITDMPKAPDSIGFCGYDKYDPLWHHQEDGALDERRDAVIKGMPKAPGSVGFCPDRYPQHNQKFRSVNFGRRDAIVKGMPAAADSVGFSHDPYAAPLTLDKIGYFDPMRPAGANIVRPKPLRVVPSFTVTKTGKYSKLDPLVKH